ncbi:2-keto-4-pentenoate hydratase [Nevskia sp.]|uniref:2-keto-4-pentenoate hydratase n=1 Tax=Nevskia sp. TaxID=1929292 RepID=UPI003F6FE5D7
MPSDLSIAKTATSHAMPQNPDVPADDPRRDALLQRLAHELATAEREGRRIRLLTEQVPDLSIAEAYTITRLRFAHLGRARVGYKLGYTSRAMREQMGIAEPNYGLLGEGMVLGPSPVTIEAGQLVHPRVEPELTLELGAPLQGPGCTEAAASAAIAKVYPSLEVVDTRYHAYQFTLRDNIADNSSSARCVLGAPVAFTPQLDLKTCVVELRGSDGVLAFGVGADALGDPVRALAWLANALAVHGESLRPCDRVMTGGLTRAFPIAAGERLTASFAGIGSVELRLR